MPGIVGIISQEPLDHCQRLVASMVGSMEHESFYRSGTYSVPDLGVYGGWVAHEGSFAASQVFHNERRDVSLIFSGECFADPDIRQQLRHKGHQVGDGAGDWLVHLYEEEGEDFFGALNGLFSGLLIDERRQRAFLFNDRYGIERIYWYETPDATYFASEAKALLRVRPELRAFDADGLAQFLTFGCTLEWRTLFRGVEVLPGGSVWTFENGRCRKGRYFQPAQWEAEPLAEADFDARFQETFKRILPRYFVSDSRIGVSLTGGLDTRMIMACRPATAEPPVCYTFAGTTGETLDTRLAGRVAATARLDHYLLRVGPSLFTEFGSYVDRTVYVTDGCFGAIGTHEIHLHEQARRLAPVRLTGNYGSEVLRSVSTFKPLGLAPELLGSGISRSALAAARELAHSGDHPITFAAFKEIPWNLFGTLAAGRSQVTFRTPYLDNEIVALAFQAPASARRSSAGALRLIQANDPVLSRIPTDRGLGGANGRLTSALRRLYAEATFRLEYHLSDGAPHWLAPLLPFLEPLNAAIGLQGLHKYLHYRAWFKRELAGFVEERLREIAARRNELWNSAVLERLAREHIRGRRNYVREINAVLTLDAVDRLLFRAAGAPTRNG